jgi:multifunctional beta-oxidation protein
VGSSLILYNKTIVDAGNHFRPRSSAGGKAAAAPGSVAEGAKIVQAAVNAFGTVHILVNNAGILRDRSFKKMSRQELDLVLLVHLKGAFECTKACWPLFRKQKVRTCYWF